MLKKVGFHNGLIPIGNANVYQCKPVWTDGRVAYGWHYTPQHIPRLGTPHKSLDGGIFTNTWTNPTHTAEYYRDGNKMLLLTDDLTWTVTGDAQGFEEYFYGTMYYYCYPWLVDYNTKRIFTTNKSYYYVGKPLAIDSSGNLLTFEATWDSDIGWYIGKLHNYDADGHDTVTRLDEVEDEELCDYLMATVNNYYNWGFYSTMDAGLPFQITTTNGAYITKATPGGDLPLYLWLSWWYDSYDPDPNISVNDYYIFYERNSNNGEYASYLPNPLTMYFRFNFELYVNRNYYMYIIPKTDITREEFDTYFYDLRVPFTTNTYEHYYCGNGNISRANTFPSTVILSPNITMRMSDLGLIINKNNNNSITYPNDPLDLLPKVNRYGNETDYFVNPGRIYAYNDIVLCAQDGREYNNFNGFVWHDGNKIINQNHYTKITSCYAASYIPDGKWII